MSPLSWLGIGLALVAAAGQSSAYVLSRRFIVTRHGGSARLLVVSHTMLAALGAVALPLLWNDRAADPRGYGWFVIGAGGFYMAGQAALFIALRQADASRVSPLLGLKVLMVAIVWVGLLGETIAGWQWAAVGLSVVAAFMLNYSGGSLPAPVIASTLLTCLCYALSDVYIVRLVGALGEPGSFRAAMLAVSMVYTLCGAVSAALLPWYGSRRSRDWAAAAPYALVWFAAMLCFFTALSIVGPVLGNIVLSTRGLWSIVLGIVLAWAGLEHLERRISGGVLARRAAAAALMIAAIALFQIGGPGDGEGRTPPPPDRGLPPAQAGGRGQDNPAPPRGP